MVGGDNFESKSKDSSEYSNSRNFNESGNAKEFLNTVDKTKDGAKDMVTELNKTSFGKEIAGYVKKGREMKEEIKENNLSEKYSKCPSTAKEGNGSKEYIKADEVLKEMGSMAEKNGYSNVDFTHNVIDKTTKDPLLVSVKGEDNGESHGITYMSGNYGPGGNNNCMIHEYQKPNGEVEYADPPVDFA